jgi:hypothetical protein
VNPPAPTERQPARRSPADARRVAGIRALVGEPVRALATTGFTLERGLGIRRARLAYRAPAGAHTTLELDPTRLRRIDIPVEPGWVRHVHAGPCPQGTVESLELELEAAAPQPDGAEAAA